VGGDSLTGYFYDYFLKDHLGNTRVILTTQKDTAQYIATMEPANRAMENALFYNIDSTSFATSAVPGGYPGGTNGGTNDSVAMVSGSVGGHTQGPALLLKVMSGDSIAIGVNAYYVGGGSAGSTTSSLPSVLNTIAGGLVALGGGSEHAALAALGGNGSPVYTALNSFLPNIDSTPTTGKPKAYLNWMLLDNQFNYVSGNGQSGAIPVGNPNVLNTLATNIKLQHSGYLYIWVSNETQNWSVFFDNLSIADYSGPMLEEDHYYPFGLTMAGISDKALKGNYAENKYRYNDGTELQNKEFSDGSGLELYETDYRGYDPQLGRFWQIDQLADINESYSPYSFANNNPILLNDPLGLISDSSHPQELDAAYVTASKKGQASKPDIAADFGPAPGSATSPIESNPTETTVGFTQIGSDDGSSSSSSGAFVLALGTLGEAGEITITGASSIPVVVGGAVIYGLGKWAWPKGPLTGPTQTPSGDISIGVPTPYIPPNLINSSYPRGESVYPFPGWDPTTPPPGYQWKGRDGSVPGDKKGSYQNPGTKEVLSPNLDHGAPYGPHWDYKDKEVDWHRLYPDGTPQQKKDR